MIKIIWNRDDFEKIKEEITNQFNITIINDPNEVPDHKIGLLLKDENEEKIKEFIESLMYQSYLVLFATIDGFVQVNVKDIIYFESFGEEIHMHLEKAETIILKEQLYRLEEKLKHFNFVRIGKSYIVNILKIRFIRTMPNAKLDLELLNGQNLHVSRSFVKNFKKAIGIQK